MFSIARYQGDNEEQETRSLEVKQERLKKLNEKFNKKRKVDESPTTDSQKKQKPSQKNKKESDSKDEQEHEMQTKEEEEEEETQQEEIVENINTEESESLEEEEEEAEEEEMDNGMEEDQSDDNDEEEEEEEDAIDTVDDKEVPTLEAFPEMLGAKAEHSKEEIQMLSKMGIPEWMLQPTTISPTSNCGLDKVGLSPHLIQRCQDHGLSYLFAVQMAVIPVFLRRQMLYDTRHVPGDLCISAPTGSGKTLAYVLPIIDILSKRRVTRLRALVVLPTRDLVTQVKETFDAFVKGTNLKVAASSGQQSFAHEQNTLVDNKEGKFHGGSSKVDILITTPGRLIDHISSTPNFTLQHLRFLVIDEADRLLNQSYNDWLNQILQATRPETRENLPFIDFQTNKNGVIEADAIAPGFLKSHYQLPETDLDLPKVPSVQKLLFSATLTKNPAKIAGLHLNDPEFISVQNDDGSEMQPEFTTPEGLKEYMTVIPTEKKPLMVLYLLHQLGIKTGLCFTKSVESTQRLQLLIEAYEALQPEDKRIKVQEYSSDLKPAQRKNLMKQFKEGKIDLLICSDLIGRGIDLDFVEFVISYDVPRYMAKYIHRVGRTARAGRDGEAYTLVEVQEARHFKAMLRESGHFSKLKTLKVEKEKLKELEPNYDQAMSTLGDA